MTILDKLKEMRRLMLNIQRMTDEYKAMQPTPPPIQIDGMPHGAGEGDAIPRFVSAKDELADRIAKNCLKYGKLKLEVDPFLDELPAHLLSFCLYYYFNALKVSDISKITGHGKSTLYNYKRELREVAGKFVCDGGADVSVLRSHNDSN